MRAGGEAKGPHGTGHTLAISDATLAAYFNLQDRLAQIFVVSNRDIPDLKAPCLVGPQSGIDRRNVVARSMPSFIISLSISLLDISRFTSRSGRWQTRECLLLA